MDGAHDNTDQDCIDSIKKATQIGYMWPAENVILEPRRHLHTNICTRPPRRHTYTRACVFII